MASKSSTVYGTKEAAQTEDKTEVDQQINMFLD